jgi:hypothetical protein
MADVNPRGGIYKKWSFGWWVTALFLAVAVVGLMLTLKASYDALTEPDMPNAQQTLLKLAGIWAIAAPIWFSLEYFLLYRNWAEDGSWELFKHGQQVSVAVWAGIAASLFAAGSSDLVKPRKQGNDCKIVLQTVAASASGPGELRVICEVAK